VRTDVGLPSLEGRVDDGAYLLTMRSDTFQILSWGADEIIAHDNDSDICRITVLTMNMNSNEVYAVTRDNESSQCRDALPTLPALDKPRIARLVPSFDVTFDFWHKRLALLRGYMNSRVRQELEATLKTND